MKPAGDDKEAKEPKAEADDDKPPEARNRRYRRL